MRTLRTQALVIGAGPAGSVAARVLASKGIGVVLADRHTFPRDKACGDALIPDALRVLTALESKDEVVASGISLREIRIYAPNQTCVSFPGEFACVPRMHLDRILKDHAVREGATFLAPSALEEPIVAGDRIAGATFRGRSEEEVRVEADVTLLATGASVGPLDTFGVCLRRAPSAFAVRIYVRVGEWRPDEMPYLCISYDRTICPGYGWIFPGPGGVYNVGVGYFNGERKAPPTQNLRDLLDRFLESFPPAREILSRALDVSAPKGAPIRTSIEGSLLGRPGLVVVGEAAGLTYSFSGEGIGKAMESAVIAADLVERALGTGTAGLAALPSDYSEKIRLELGPRFRAYSRAQHWLSSPLFANLLAWRATRRGFARRQLEDLLLEKGDPLALFSVPGIVRAMVA